jgi:hypothetical protein
MDTKNNENIEEIALNIQTDPSVNKVDVSKLKQKRFRLAFFYKRTRKDLPPCTIVTSTTYDLFLQRLEVLKKKAETSDYFQQYEEFALVVEEGYFLYRYGEFLEIPMEKFEHKTYYGGEF